MRIGKIVTSGLGAWLQFEWSSGRSTLFSERYMTPAIGQILTAQADGRVVIERPHPILQAFAKGAGRKPAIDFVVYERFPDKIKVAIETKWVGATAPTPQSIIWDLIRLELVSHAHGAECYFIIAGKHGPLERFFARQGFVGRILAGQRRPILNHRKGVTRDLALTPNHVRNSLMKKVFWEYQDYDFPHFVRCMRVKPYLESPTNDQYQVHCWKICPKPGRPTFKPMNSKHYARTG